ncbi:MAG: TIGR03915 family putative DNA repair protein [Defluviitaleaceae bacterium]|nr:TIGR03915 family putative DNA repair protein [Defluviitaleaceae bacterium]MCL2275551.1 TIGR03915 family putative DNA repair protein [Defluviitaleaceae bacterium]
MPSAPRKEVDIVFDGTFEGFLCVVYAFYYEGITPLSIQTADALQPSLMQEEFFIVTNNDNACKVEKAIRKKISHDAYYTVAYAFLSSADDRFMCMLHYIVYGFKMGHRVDDHLHHDFILRVHKCAREVGREAHLLKGFCRFAETAQGILYCAVTPIHHVLMPLAEHFADRMMEQSWVIHDKRHNKAVVYNGESCVFVDVTPNTVPPIYAENEAQIQELWTSYFNTAAITARKNPKLHRNMLPMRFRGDMVEFGGTGRADSTIS